QQMSRIFTVSAGNTVGLVGLWLQHGHDNNGGGAILNQGTLGLQSCVVVNNWVQDTGINHPVFRGGIYNATGPSLTGGSSGIIGNLALAQGTDLVPLPRRTPAWGDVRLLQPGRHRARHGV